MIEDQRDATCIDYLGVKVFLHGTTITVFNVYNPYDSEEVPKPPSSMIHSDTVLLCGDFNARHPLLGSEGSTIGKMVRFIMTISITLATPYIYYVP